MKTFVVGDIHGAAKALAQCLDRSGFDSTNDLLIQLGDVVDRYNEVFECVEILLGIDNLIALRGNHDDWFNDFLATGTHPRDWIYGGVDTAKSYLNHAGKAAVFRAEGEGHATNLAISDVPATHREFFARQQAYYVDGHNRCFVHGGFNPRLPVNQQPPETFYWDRVLWQNAYEHKRMYGDDEPAGNGIVPSFSEVYLGHTPTTRWETDQPLKAFNIWNVDTGVANSGRLTIMDVDTNEYWQSDPLPILYT